MDFNILKVKGYNLSLYLLIGIQFIILIGIAVLLISILSKGFVSVDTVLSAVLLFMLGLPLLFLLYRSSDNSTLRTMLKGLIYSYSLLCASGFTWYVLPGILGMQWLIYAAKFLMILSYIPMILAMYPIYSANSKKLTQNAKIIVAYIGLLSAIIIILFSVINSGAGNLFDVGIYTLSTVLDITVVSLSIFLIFIYAPTQLRYVFSIVLIYTIISFFGDFLNLLTYLQVRAIPIPSQIFYDAMLLFAVGAFLIYSLFREISTVTVEEVNRRLDDTRHAMGDLIMQMPDAACFCDTNGIALLVNDQFLRVFGTQRERVIGKFNLFTHDQLLNCKSGQNIPLLKKGETIHISSIPVVFPGKRQVYLSVKLFPTFSRDREVSGFVAFVEDITERVQAEEELKYAKGLAELYIDLMSHDINNMNQVGMGYLEIALDTLGVEDDKKYLLTKPLEFLGNSSRLIENVKKLRRASEGDAYLRPVDLGKVLKGVIAEHGQAPGRDVSIEYDVAENALVKANELLKDVFVNLVSNSIKHSSGTVRIGIKQELAVSGGRKYYRVTVEDDGPGIPDDLKPVIFDRLLRGRGRNGSSGLGLYLVKALIDSYGGTIAVEDRVPGDRTRGARFIITLPEAQSN